MRAVVKMLSDKETEGCGLDGVWAVAASGWRRGDLRLGLVVAGGSGAGVGCEESTSWGLEDELASAGPYERRERCSRTLFDLDGDVWVSILRCFRGVGMPL